MNIEDLGNSKIINLITKPAGFIMGSRVRQWLMDPVKTLKGADIQSGQTILEVGCGTGFFTVKAAQLVGNHGCIVALDVLSDFVNQVSKKVEAANLNNVKIIKRNALDTGLDANSIDKVLLFGVVPYPSLPLDQLLPEMHRILRPEGSLAAWLYPFPLWVPKSISRSGLFSFSIKRNGVYNYTKC